MAKIRWIVGTVLAAGLTLPTANAVAVSSYGGGAHAWAPAQNNPGKIAVKDNSDDGDPVKAEYYRQSSPGTKRTLWNHSGHRRTVYSGGGSKIIRLRAIDENDHAPDDVGPWVAP
ncbi:hypothetical protein ACFQ08_29855 [Streptosporangium algeriense]|uniref:Uncharacterized protein n=1 Tax=Streptosporangium algeriense TaxID=1682748 RepID=A0ABW3DY84_9ACTN